MMMIMKLERITTEVTRCLLATLLGEYWLFLHLA